MTSDVDPVGWSHDVRGRCSFPCCAEVPAAASLAAGAIGRSVVDAAAAYRSHLSTLLDPPSTVQDCTDEDAPTAVTPEASTAVNPGP